MNSIRPMRSGERKSPTSHYVALLLPTDYGEWRVLFPDVPNCEARGFTVHDATYAAATALARHAEKGGQKLPPPRSLARIEGDQAWLSKTGIELSKAVVMMVPLSSRLDAA